VQKVLIYVYKQDLEAQMTGVLRTHLPEEAVNRPVSISKNMASNSMMVANKKREKLLEAELMS
jgi:hypothetical protein